jgi:hypothetical protein
MNLIHLTIRSSKRLQKATPMQNFSSSYPSSNIMDKYIRNIRAMNKATAHEYYFRLMTFQNFITNDCKTTLDNLITGIRQGHEDPYDILSNYVK